MKKKITIISIVILVIVFIVLGIISKNRTNLMEVSAHTVKAEDFTKEISANGEIISKKSIQIVSSVTGSVSKVYAETGDIVKAGGILVTLDKDDLTIQYKNSIIKIETTRMTVRGELLNLRTTYIQALTNYEQAERDYKRTEKLNKIGSASDEELRLKKDAYNISRENLSSARQRLNFREGRPLNDSRETEPPSDDSIIKASPEVQQALANLESIESNLENFTFTAGIGGVVTAVNVEKGGVVTPGTVVATIHNIENLEVIANIDEVDLSYITPGQEVKIESDSFIGKELKGKVTKVAPIIRKIGDSRVCEVRIDIIGDSKKAARIGAGCSIFIDVEKKKNMPAIPVESYFIEDNEKYVFILEPTSGNEVYIAKKQIIKIGILGIETVEVTEGLKTGDLIIVSNTTGISDGDEVMIKKEQKDEE